MAASSASSSSGSMERTPEQRRIDDARAAMDTASGAHRKGGARPTLAVAEHAAASKAAIGGPRKLVADAEACMDRFEPQAAVRLLELADRQLPGDADILERLGEAKMETGDVEGAKAAFNASVEARSSGGSTRFLQLAQLSSGKEAVAHFGAAVTRLREELGASTRERPAALVRRQLSQALASIAELYMTDLCDEPDAESQCEKAAGMAVEADRACADALLALASLRLVRQRIEDARPLLRQAAKLVVDAHARLVAREKAEAELAAAGAGEGASSSSSGPSTASSSSGAGAGAGAASGAATGGAAAMEGEGAGAGSAGGKGSGASGGEEGDDDDVLGPLAVPDVGARMSLGRSCLEAGEYEGAVGVLHTVLAEDEQTWEAWYRLAQACVGTADPDAALDTIEQAGKLIDKRRGLCVAVQEASKKGPLAVQQAMQAAEMAGMGSLPTVEEATEELPELKAAHGQLGALRGAIRSRKYDGPGSEVMRARTRGGGSAGSS